MVIFSQDEAQAIADALGHTEDDLTGGEITQLLVLARMTSH